MKVGRQTRGDAGLTLLELVVVTSILAVLSAIIALSVTGHGTESRNAAKAADETTIQQAVDRYTGEHPGGHHPTLNGCTPGLILNKSSLKCVPGDNNPDPDKFDTENLEFRFREDLSDVDLNRDGDKIDEFKVVPIIWHKAFNTRLGLSTEEDTKRFLGNFVPRVPKHAFEFLSGADDSWEDAENTDPDGLGNISSDPNKITAPAGIGFGPNKIDLRLGNVQVPVWVLGVFNQNSGVEVRNLLPKGGY